MLYGYYEDGYWKEGYWGLFWETGAPEFYLLRKKQGVTVPADRGNLAQAPVDGLTGQAEGFHIGD